SGTATTTLVVCRLSLHDALPILVAARGVDVESGASPYAEKRKQKDLGLIYLRDRTTINLGYSTSKENDFDSTTYSFSISQTFFRSEEHTSELQSRENLVCRLLLE